MKNHNLINSYSGHRLRRDRITIKERTWIYIDFYNQLEKSRGVKNV
jgi:hypothetical protein